MHKKINNNLSNWYNVNTGVPQGSIFAPFIFNIYIYDMFYLVKYENLTNFADDNTPYVISNDIDEIISKLETGSTILIKWFEINCLKMNADKCKLLVTNQEDDIAATVDGQTIKADKSVKFSA